VGATEPGEGETEARHGQSTDMSGGVTLDGMEGVRVEKALFEKRAAEKRKSREGDERALRSGKKSREQLRKRTGSSRA
jgi:hypothetical protein